MGKNESITDLDKQMLGDQASAVETKTEDVEASEVKTITDGDVTPKQKEKSKKKKKDKGEKKDGSKSPKAEEVKEVKDVKKDAKAKKELNAKHKKDRTPAKLKRKEEFWTNTPGLT